MITEQEAKTVLTKLFKEGTDRFPNKEFHPDDIGGAVVNISRDIYIMPDSANTVDSFKKVMYDRVMDICFGFYVQNKQERIVAPYDRVPPRKVEFSVVGTLENGIGYSFYSYYNLLTDMTIFRLTIGAYIG